MSGEFTCQKESETMLPMRALRLKLGTLLAADVPTLAPVAANKIALLNAPVAITENLVLAGLSFATFTGSAPIAGAAGPQGVGNDPATGDQIITILTPVGGWRFVCTVTPIAPEVIYGFALTDNAGAVLLGAQLLTSPVSIAAIADEIDLGAVPITFVVSPMS
jgi:hypothetical protein